MMTKPEDSSREEQCLPGVFRIPERLLSAYMDSAGTAILYANSLTRTFTDFVSPFLIAANSFWDEEKRRIPETPQEDNISDYNKLFRFNMQIASTGLRSSAIQMHEYHRREFKRFALALFNTLVGDEGRETVDEYMAEKAKILHMLAVDYPDAIRDVGEEYGFHFDNGRYIKVSDTDRMDLYQVLPTEPGVEVRPELKPIMVVHPYVLGASILAFLPGERKSYVHAFANQGIPTYVRIVKDIASNPSVQEMTGEDDARDTAVFCKLIKERHGRQVTLNGFCQGGFVSLADVLTGELDGLVDTLITCVAPMDGTRSKGLVEYLEHITPRFRDLAYATKTMPGGGRVIDGTVMSWVYKLKSIEREAPLFTYYRDLNLFQTMVHKGLPGISKTAAAINHWLMYDRNDLPVSMTQMSFDSYTVPVSSRGELPFKLFGRTLNFDYIREKDIKFQICYAAKDDLVDKPSAKAPMDFVDVELAEFPKGHAAIATSWSHPETDYALHKRFPNGQRGPVRLQLDLSDAVEGGINSAA
jgi:hypothetical protein